MTVRPSDGRINKLIAYGILANHRPPMKPIDAFPFVVTAISGWMRRHQEEVTADLVEENRVLREQMGSRRLKFNDDQRRRLAAKAKRLVRQTLDEVATIAAPETLLTWHRNLIGRTHAGGTCRTPGRPATRPEIAALAVRMAEENRSWGYRRIQGALSNLGHDLAHNTVRNILKRRGIDPAPERARRTTGKEFLQIHWQQIAAADFFAMTLSNRSRLASLFILCFMKMSARRADVLGTSRGTDGRSMIEVAGEMMHDMRSFCSRKCDLRAEEHSGIASRHNRNRNEPSLANVENGLILPFAARDQKVSRIKRWQPRDRL
jgi:hypothetical protein